MGSGGRRKRNAETWYARIGEHFGVLRVTECDVQNKMGVLHASSRFGLQYRLVAFPAQGCLFRITLIVDF